VVSQRRVFRIIALSAAVGFCLARPAAAETMSEALASAYANNPSLNAQRASLRATDEGVPQALSGYRPTISATATAEAVSLHNTVLGDFHYYPRSIGVTITQPIFRGFRTQNGVKAAEAAVLAGREILKQTEQDVLLNATSAFMDVIYYQALLNIRSQNIQFLEEQLRAAKDRLDVGEGTRTDVAQTDAALALGRSTYNAAAASLNAARATYEQVVGHAPKKLGSIKSVDHLLPKSLDGGLDTAGKIHPSILAANYNIDIASFNVKVLEGELLPTISVQGDIGRSIDSSATSTGVSDSASIMGVVSVPIYQAGLPSSEIRQAKETLGQRRIELDSARSEIRQAVVSYWGQLEAARAQIAATNTQVSAAQLALNGVIEERKVGQRTTLDVLSTQQDLLDARIAQVTAQRDRVVAAYALLASIGKLNADSLALNVARYNPTDHYEKVRDKWGGLRTPDGR
jgi:outer membrane protein